MMMSAKRYQESRTVLSLIGMIGFLLFATRINYQYSFDRSADASDPDPVFLTARNVSAIRGAIGDQVPVEIEILAPATFRAPRYQVAYNQRPCLWLVNADWAIPSPRGPPRA
jgi:hypothetical protein